MKPVVKIKSLLFILLISFVSTFFSSCFYIPYISGIQEPKTPRQFLEKNFSGTFTNERAIRSPTDSERMNFENGECTYKKFYSSALEQDIVVKTEKFYTNSDYIIEFSTNFLFLKYQEAIEKILKQYISPDFSDVRVLYDYDWMFSSISDESISEKDFINTILWDLFDKPSYVLIHVSEDELADYEKRLHSVIYRIYSLNHSNVYDIYYDFSPIYFYLTNPESQAVKEIDFSSTTVDDLYNSEYLSFFAKRYKKASIACRITEVEDE
ncbi:MAG: hypothetical protein K5829_15515 [Treponema sp.]|nr:hypothetical protein [Treponema sp.]